MSVYSSVQQCQKREYNRVDGQQHYHKWCLEPNKTPINNPMPKLKICSNIFLPIFFWNNYIHHLVNNRGNPLRRSARRAQLKGSQHLSKTLSTSGAIRFPLFSAVQHAPCFQHCSHRVTALMCNCCPHLPFLSTASASSQHRLCHWSPAFHTRAWCLLTCTPFP